jgi:fumarylacetoacetase
MDRIDPKRKSFVESANDPVCSYPIQNLPYGVFATSSQPQRRAGVAIGDFILDLALLENEGLLPRRACGSLFNRPSLNGFMSMGQAVWHETRSRIAALLDRDNPELRDNASIRNAVLVPQAEATLAMPIEVRGYTDFYSSKEHATNVGSMFRDPKNALLPNWSHIPIAYNGRASTVVVSGTPIHRPLGQIKLPDADAPILGPCRKLDFELEMGTVIGQASAHGRPIRMAEAPPMIFGFVLLNDWSARDIQQWENVPLGPFQAKVFATSISPWVVTRDALEPFRTKGPDQNPPPLAYLAEPGPRNYDVHLEVRLRPKGASKATVICRTNFKGMYWSSVQQLLHHAIGGCAMEVGDLLGSGTISGANPASYGSMLELTWNGATPILLDGGGERRFIEDGDEIVMTGWCQGDGYRIGFGEVSGHILPAPEREQTS